MNWIPIEEKLPPDCIKVLICYDKYYYHKKPSKYDIDFGRYVASLDEFRIWGGNSDFKECITHWMKLPRLPNGEKHENNI